MTTRKHFSKVEIREIVAEWHARRPDMKSKKDSGIFDNQIGEKYNRSSTSIQQLRCKMGLVMWHQGRKNGEKLSMSEERRLALMGVSGKRTASQERRIGVMKKSEGKAMFCKYCGNPRD